LPWSALLLQSGVVPQLLAAAAASAFSPSWLTIQASPGLTNYYIFSSLLAGFANKPSFITGNIPKKFTKVRQYRLDPGRNSVLSHHRVAVYGPNSSSIPQHHRDAWDAQPNAIFKASIQAKNEEHVGVEAQRDQQLAPNSLQRGSAGIALN